MTKKIDYNALAEALEHEVWYSGPQLDKEWGSKATDRSWRIKKMVGMKLMRTKGKSSNLRYQRVGLKPPVLEAVPTTTLDELITAASKVGTENEVMRKALLQTRELIDKALEAIQ